MKKRKIWIIIIIGFSILFIGLIIRPTASFYYYNFLEYWKSRNSIKWRKTKKLTWDDFKYNPDFDRKLYADVKLMLRFRIEDPYFTRSQSLFFPEKSVISDTTNINILRAAQAKWDLLEIYRIKMVKAADSIRKSNTILQVEDFDKLTERFYNEFEKEWDKYKEKAHNIGVEKTLKEMEKRIQLELK